MACFDRQNELEALVFQVQADFRDLQLHSFWNDSVTNRMYPACVLEDKRHTEQG